MTKNFPENEAPDEHRNWEWNEWRAVCKILLDHGAITMGDLQSPVTHNETPGQKILNQIRIWGEAYATLTKAFGDKS